jgi:hypothetical protein
MRFDRHDRATVRAALLLAIDTTKNEIAGSAGEDPAQQQRRASAERLFSRFEDLMERLRRPRNLRVEASNPPAENAPFHAPNARQEKAPREEGL